MKQLCVFQKKEKSFYRFEDHFSCMAFSGTLEKEKTAVAVFRDGSTFQYENGVEIPDQETHD